MGRKTIYSTIAKREAEKAKLTFGNIIKEIKYKELPRDFRDHIEKHSFGYDFHSETKLDTVVKVLRHDLMIEYANEEVNEESVKDILIYIEYFVDRIIKQKLEALNW